MPETVKREYTAKSKKMVPGSTIKHGSVKAKGGGKFPKGIRGKKATGSKWPAEQTLKDFTQLPPVKRWPKKGG